MLSPPTGAARPAAHGQQPYVVPNGSTECVSRCCQRRGSGRERKFRSRGISLSGWPKVSVPLPFLRALDSGLLWGDPGQVRLRPSACRFAQGPLTPPEAPRGLPCMQPTGRPEEPPCLERSILRDKGCPCHSVASILQPGPPASNAPGPPHLMHLGACLQSDPGPRLLPTAPGALAEAGGLRVLSRTFLSGKPGDSVGQHE